jgi:3-methyladenine DNA glycosylase AlkD
MRSLHLLAAAATDERNFVKKGVSWALRSVGRRNQALNEAAVDLARRLAESAEAVPRWVGKDALRDITRPMVQRRLTRRGA